MNADARMTRRLQLEESWNGIVMNLGQSVINSVSSFGISYQGPRVADLKFSDAVIALGDGGTPLRPRITVNLDDKNSITLVLRPSLIASERDELSIATGDDWA